jgi:hypothetical protein
MNMELLELVLQLLHLPVSLKQTESYIEKYPESHEGKKVLDLRDKIHPRHSFPETEKYANKPYRQVFQEKYGYVENLSILDLLLNQGPKSVEYLVRK